MKNVASAGLLIGLLLASSGVGAAEEEVWDILPNKVTITPEKTKLMPGEEIDVTLTGFMNPYGVPAVGNPEVGVWVDNGAVWNGHSWVDDSDPIFPIGAGKVLFKYRAPINEATDTIRIYVVVKNVEQVPEEWEVEVGEVIPIGEQSVEITYVDNAKMKYHEYYRNEQGEVPSVTDITVIVGLHFEVLKPDHPSATARLGGFGVGIPYRVTSATVHSATGSYTGKDCNFRLVSATPAHWNTAIMVYNNQSGAIESVKLPLIAAMLNWAGDGDCVPPEQVTVGPVTEWDEDADKKKFDQLADEIEVDMQTQGYPDFADIMKMQQAIKKVVVHPDYMAKIQISQDHAGNDARFEDSGDGWRLQKEFSWEIERDVSPVPLTK